MSLQAANTNDFTHEEECDGSSKGAVIIRLPLARKTQKLEIIQGGKDQKNNKPETEFEKTRRENAEAVQRALREEGTMNTDFIRRADGSRNIGTHTLRPIAFIGESILPEQETHPTHGILHEDIIKTPEGRAQRRRELLELQEWLKDIPENTKKGLEEAMKTIHTRTTNQPSGFRPRIIENDSF